MAKISCLLLSHNKPAYLPDAVESVIKQTHKDWQLVIMDSGFLYDRNYFDRRFVCDMRISIVKSGETDAMREQLHIPSYCYNYAYRQCLLTGDLVVYLSDDDYFLPNAFADFVSFFAAHPTAVACYGAQDVFRWEGTWQFVGTRLADMPAVAGSIDCQLDGLQFCIRKSVLAEVKWNESKNAAQHADGIFFESVAARYGAIAAIPVKVSVTRRTPESRFCPR